MANIKQQRKRVKIARRERLENLRYKSRIKTMFKSLSVAAEEDKDRAGQLGLELVSVIDKAASRGVLHANAAARKKSQVYHIIQLPEGVAKAAGPATKESASGKSKAESRAERLDARATRKTEAKKRQQARAEAQAEAAKAEAEAAPAAEAAEEAPAEAEATPEEEPEAAAEEAADEEAPAEEAAEPEEKREESE